MEIDILQFFSKKEVETVAKETSFVERRSPITGLKFLITFTTGILSVPDGTLAQIAGFLSCACQTGVSPQAVDERINTMAEDFLQKCLLKALTMSKRPLVFEKGILAKFDHVYIIDSTNFELHPSLSDKFKGNSGGASKASMRIQLVLDYLKGTLHVEIGDTQLTDATTLHDLVERQRVDMSGQCLFLSDLGYFKTTTFEKLTEMDNQYFLSKLKFGVKIKDIHGAEIDLHALLKKRPDQFDMAISIGGLKCRLTGKRLSDTIVNQRIRKANEASERKGGITDAYKLFLSYALCITNLPPQYEIDILFILYRIRWRIELVFKTWKSILVIHKIRSAKKERVMCEVYGKLIVAALSFMMCAVAEKCLEGVVISLHRAMRHIRVIALAWASVIMKGIKEHANFIENLKRDIAKLCIKRNQKKKPVIEYLIKETVIPNEN